MNTSSESSWLIEQRVLHPDFGFGTILRVRFGGIHAYVQFHNGLKLWVRTADLKFLEPRKSDKAQPQRIPITLPERIRVLQMIEAFKLGIVPGEDVPHFTFGRDKQIQFVKETLKDLARGGTALLVEGPYGSGKTHFASYIEYLALQQGFAVARADLDPVEVSPYKPKRIYRALMSTLRWPRPDGEVGNFDDAFETLLIPSDIDMDDHHYFRIFYRIRKRNPSNAQIASLKAWLSGELFDRGDLDRLRIPGLPLLYDHTTAADHLCYLLTGWSIFFKKHHLKGLLLIFDEAETVFNYAHRFEKHRGMNTLRGLIDVALGRRETLRSRPLHFDPHQRCYLDESGHVHSGIKPLPYAYQLPAYLGVIFTVTPVVDTWYARLKALVPETRHLVLWNLVTDDYREILAYVVRLYQSIYPEVNLKTPERESLFQSLKSLLWEGTEPPNPRRFLKALLEALEIRRHEPGISWNRLLEPPSFRSIYRVL